MTPEDELRDLEARLPQLRIQASQLNRQGNWNEALTAQRAYEAARDRYTSLQASLHPGEPGAAGETLAEWVGAHTWLLWPVLIVGLVLLACGLVLLLH